jgi:hypothetical protein
MVTPTRLIITFVRTLPVFSFFFLATTVAPITVVEQSKACTVLYGSNLVDLEGKAHSLIDVIFRNLPDFTEESKENLSRNLNQIFQNTNLVRYNYTSLLGR